MSSQVNGVVPNPRDHLGPDDALPTRSVAACIIMAFTSLIQIQTAKGRQDLGPYNWSLQSAKLATRSVEELHFSDLFRWPTHNASVAPILHVIVCKLGFKYQVESEQP